MIPTRKPCDSKQATNNCHTKTWVINISIARDNDDVARIPTQIIHLIARHRQHRRSAKFVWPKFAIGEKIGRGNVHGGILYAECVLFVMFYGVKSSFLAHVLFVGNTSIHLR